MKKLVERSEVIKDFQQIDLSDKSAKTANTSTVIARKWPFKRPKAIGNV
jgi:hypothetical protein